MSMRKITSMTLLLSMLVLLLNSIVLYVVPQGRVAYWADWTFLGLTKTDWAEQHITVGFLFLVAGLLHLYYNWNPILAYMRNRAREFKLVTLPFNIAFLLTLAFVVGTYYKIPPMSTIVTISEHFKDAAAKEYGEPPYGHAESSSLKMFASKEGLDLRKSVDLLKAANIDVRSEKDIIKDLAKKAGKSPQEIYLIIKPAAVEADPDPSISRKTSVGPQAFLNNSKSGLGKRTVSDLCTEYHLDFDEMLRGLNERGITTDGSQKLRDLAEKSGSSPMVIYEAMREIVQEKMIQ
jgi:hypothetical protein